MREIKTSGARVIVACVYTPWYLVVEAAIKAELVGPDYVWIVSDYNVGITPPTFSDFDSTRETQGLIGSFVFIDYSAPLLAMFEERWDMADKEIYPGTTGPPNPYYYLIRDMIYTAGLAAHDLDQRDLLDQERIPAEQWTEAIRKVKFEGVSGSISFDEFGDRPMGNQVLSWNSTSSEYDPVGVWFPESGYIETSKVVWFDLTTNIPDLDIRPPFDYWSCHDRKVRTDKTGKTIKLRKPDGRDIDQIEEDYHCDNFIDCRNLSDEHNDCNHSYIGLFKSQLDC